MKNCCALFAHKEENDMATEKQINDQLFKLQKQSREGLMKLMGVDIPKLRTFEKDMIKKYNKLEKEMQRIYKISGKEVAKRHKASHARAQKIIHKNIESMLSARRHYPDIGLYRYLCTCYFPYTAEAENFGEEITLTPSFGSTNSGSVIFDAGTNIAHPFATAHSPGTGDWSGARVKSWFTFSFTPDSDGTYCIFPVVHLNGYWMLWSGAGCESFESLPVIELVARVKVRVDQLSSTVRTTSHDVVNGSSSGTYASGFDYDSEVNEELMMEVPLTGGDQAIVFVESELIVGANNLGRSRIDMQSSPHFYFEVPLVRWGRPCDRLFPINLP
jgi:hypothetical protein